MERAKKLMATTKLNSYDRFSDLPADIVYHILSHLPLRDLARLGTVSKRCRDLCISNPTLSFRIKWPRSKSRRCSFFNFLDRLMALRRLNNVKTQRFHLEWNSVRAFEDEEYQLRMWLQHVVNSSVEDICLDIRHHQPVFSLPFFVLGCKSLRSLKVSVHIPFRLPSSLSIPSFADKLEVFVLKGVDAKNESLGEWFSSFKSLRVLKLDALSGVETITITNSSVETLIITRHNWGVQNVDIQNLQKLQHLFIEGYVWSYDSPSIKISAPNLRSLSLIWEAPVSRKTSLEISAPNLQRFQWFGNIVDDYYMENSPSLSYVSVGLLPRWGERAIHASIKHSLEKVLHCICGAKNLTLWNDFVRVLHMHDCLPFLFGNVEHLAIRGPLSSTRLKPLSYLLQGATNLKHLILVKNKKAPPFLMKYKQSQNLQFSHLLKTRAVEFFNGKKEVEQIKHVLKNAKELVVLAILSTLPVSQDCIEFKEFMIPSLEDY